MSSPAPFDPYLEWLGIEPHEQPADHYLLLGLPRFASDADAIRAAADSRMSHVHSFQTGPRGIYTQSLLNELSAARLCLLDPQAKAQYDAQLARRAAASATGPSMPPPAPATSTVAPPAIAPMGGAVLSQGSVEPAAPGVVAPPVGRASLTSGGRQPDWEADVDTGELAPRSSAWWLWLVPLLVAAVLVVAGLVWGVGRSQLAHTQQGGDNGTQVTDSGDTADSDGDSDGEEDGTSPDSPSIVVVQQAADGALRFLVTDAQIHGTALRIEKGPASSTAVNWILHDDWLSWDFRVKKPAIFRVKIVYRAAADAEDGQYELAVDDERKTASVRPSPPDSECTDELFLAVKRSGRHTLSMRVIAKPGAELLSLKEIRFAPATGFR